MWKLLQGDRSQTSAKLKTPLLQVQQPRSKFLCYQGRHDQNLILIFLLRTNVA